MPIQIKFYEYADSALSGRKPYLSMNIPTKLYPAVNCPPAQFEVQNFFSTADISTETISRFLVRFEVQKGLFAGGHLFRNHKLFSNATALMVSIIETRPLALVGERFSLRPIWLMKLKSSAAISFGVRPE